MAASRKKPMLFTEHKVRMMLEEASKRASPCHSLTLEKGWTEFRSKLALKKERTLVSNVP